MIPFHNNKDSNINKFLISFFHPCLVYFLNKFHLFGVLLFYNNQLLFNYFLNNLHISLFFLNTQVLFPEFCRSHKLLQDLVNFLGFKFAKLGFNSSISIKEHDLSFAPLIQTLIFKPSFLTSSNTFFN